MRDIKTPIVQRVTSHGTRYDYNETYFAEASFRRDGSSIFHTDHRWGNFWSVGIGWMLSNEAFLKNVSWLNRLKLRVSYGQVGNDNFGSSNYCTSGCLSTALPSTVEKPLTTKCRTKTRN
ncbi:TonB-dependent receptor [Bacteroides ovatus]|nr:TonB-dependent receptor [Bacteroides ovatus]